MSDLSCGYVRSCRQRAVVLVVVILGLAWAAHARAAGVGITQLGSTDYQVMPLGYASQTDALQVTMDASNACCVNPEWSPWSLPAQSWLVNGDDGRRGAGAPLPKLWGFTQHLSAGDTFITTMDVGGVCCRSDDPRYAGREANVSLGFGLTDTAGQRVLWESGHVLAQRALISQQVSVFVADRDLDLDIWVYDLTREFWNNDFFLALRGELIEGPKPDVPVVPEPASLVLLGSVLCGAAALRQRWGRGRSEQ